MKKETIQSTKNQYTRSKNDLEDGLDGDAEDVPVNTGHSLLDTTNRITLLFIVQSLLHHNPPNIWIKIIQIECFHRRKFLDTDRDGYLDNSAPCKRSKRGPHRLTEVHTLLQHGGHLSVLARLRN